MEAPALIDCEAAGRAFLIHYLQNLIYNESHQQNGNNSNKLNSKNKQKKKKKKKKKQINIEIDWDCDLEDYYALLGIKKYEMNISQDNLKRACKYLFYIFYVLNSKMSFYCFCILIEC